MKRTEDGFAATMNPPKGTPQQEAMMKRAEAAGRPGPGHKALEHFVGAWNAEVKCWMEPGAPPHVSQATANGSWKMGGRFLQEDFQGDMDGKAFHGRTMLGYDNVTQLFQSVWISDMQTSMFITEGSGTENNQVITLEGTTSCGATEQVHVPMKVVLRILGPDKHTFEMFNVSRGENARTMEITYTRA